ncbi:hypothetical protein [uncultured Pontibacter sp.]|uniref:hypothetical protein n=1 Tax=uncultured Pontibacter sp. TaxID=453356 RepID=UPI00262EB773|nr:hypothetical protein [uncultured Pontibacter sp.]
MKTSNLLITLCLLLLQVTAFAQNTQSETQLVKSIASERVAEITAKSSLQSKVHVYQAGTSNYASVAQRNVSSRPNGAFIEQVGVLNRAAVTQQGAGNSISATQVGTRNSYTGDLDGVGNSSTVVQKGAFNEVNQRVHGRQLDYTLIQIGNNNTINQVETSSNSKPYKVVQQGNNMNIRIEQSNVGLPPAAGAKK